MFCRNCGSEIKEGRKFCTECGAPVVKKEDFVQQEEIRSQVSEPEIQKPVEPVVPQVSPEFKPEIQKPVEPIISQATPAFEPEKEKDSSKILAISKKVFSKFNGLSKKKKIIIIVVAVLIVFAFFGKKSDTGEVKKEDYTIPTIPEITLTEAETQTEATVVETTAEEETTEKSTEKQTEKPIEKKTEKPIEKRTEKPAEKRNGVDPAFKDFWDGYEKYMDSYIKFMSSPDAIGTAEYFKVLAEYTDWCAKADEYDESECTDEEVKYMLEVQSRVSAKLMQTSLG